MSSTPAVERTKRCNGPCGRTLPWSAYFAQTKWEDGTMRRPASRCKDCRREECRLRSQRRYHAAPEAARQRVRDLRDRIAADPELNAEYQERARMYRATWRRRRGVGVTTRQVLAADTETRTSLPIGPFRAWLAEALTVFESKQQLAIAGGTTERTIWGWLGEGPGAPQSVHLDTLDRFACTLGEPGLLDHLYPIAEAVAA